MNHSNSSSTAADLPSRVALEVQSKFEALPSKSKPGLDELGKPQWVPLSGIVLSDENNSNVHTGMKCLPLSQVPAARGTVLHDWHAEILAIRLFNDFLLQEIRRSIENDGQSSSYVRKRQEAEKSVPRGLQPFTIKENLKIHMYCSEAPCGDASMELIMNAQQDTTPWAVQAIQGDNTKAAELKGRGYFSQLGIVRRKPARGDSPITLSKSCSDKIALKQFTSILLSPVTLLLSPENAYVTNLVLPRSQHINKACQRAFSETGRLKPLNGKMWQGGYAFHSIEVLSSENEFANSRRLAGPKSSNISAAWSPYRHETLINGVMQGRKQSDPRGASVVSRRRIWQTTAEIISSLEAPTLKEISATESYQDLKHSMAFEDRRTVKAEVTSLGLPGWIPNQLDDFEIGSNMNPS